MMKISRMLLLGLVGIGVLLAGLLLNVVAHEVGHFAVASAFGLEPEIYLEGAFVQYDGASFGFVGAGSPEAHVSYLTPVSGVADALVAFAGPFVNVVLSIIFGGTLILARNRGETAKFLLVLLILVSVLSAMFNLVPVTGTDGAVMLAALR